MKKRAKKRTNNETKNQNPVNGNRGTARRISRGGVMGILEIMGIIISFIAAYLLLLFFFWGGCILMAMVVPDFCLWVIKKILEQSK
jgi:hypothetical protein